MKKKSSWPQLQSRNPRNLHWFTQNRTIWVWYSSVFKTIPWTAGAFLQSKKGQGKQSVWATPTKVLLYFSVIYYYMNTILVIIRIDPVRIFSIKFVIILKIIQNSRWVPWIWFDFSFCTYLACRIQQLRVLIFTIFLTNSNRFYKFCLFVYYFVSVNRNLVHHEFVKFSIRSFWNWLLDPVSKFAYA